MHYLIWSSSIWIRKEERGRGLSTHFQEKQPQVLDATPLEEPQSGRHINKCILLTISECILRPLQVETVEENTSTWHYLNITATTAIFWDDQPNHVYIPITFAHILQYTKVVSMWMLSSEEWGKCTDMVDFSLPHFSRFLFSHSTSYIWFPAFAQRTNRAPDRNEAA